MSNGTDGVGSIEGGNERAGILPRPEQSAVRRRLGAALRAAREHRAAVALAVLLSWYAISVLAALLPPSSAWRLALDRATNRNGDYGNPEGPLEWCEAVAWVGALAAYATVLVRSFRAGRWRTNPWIPFLTLLAFVALGEELSWGQQVFRWHAPPSMQHVNLQQETNLHNLDLGAALGAHAGGRAYALLRSLMRLLNPAFYAVSFLVWLVLPLAALWGPGRRWRPTRAIPVPRNGTMLLLVVGALVFVAIDRVVIDVGETLELTVALGACLAALDLLDATPPAHEPRAPSA